jgi:hypothetical protein
MPNPNPRALIPELQAMVDMDLVTLVKTSKYADEYEVDDGSFFYVFDDSVSMHLPNGMRAFSGISTQHQAAEWIKSRIGKE